MDLLGIFRRELEVAVKRTGLEPCRPVPQNVKLKKLRDDSACRGFCLIEEELVLDSSLPRNVVISILRKEALSSLIPPEADEVPQVHDLAWAYAGIPREWWERFREKPGPPFQNYDPVDLFSCLQESERMRVIKSMLRLIRSFRKISFPSFLAILHRMINVEVKLTESDRKLLRAVSLNPSATGKDLERITKVSQATISRSLAKLRELGYIFGPQNVDLSRLGLETFVVSFPNTDRFREAFFNFPFTYSVLTPMSGSVSAYAYVLFPREGRRALLNLCRRDLRVMLVKFLRQRVNLDSPEDPLRTMLDAYESEHPEPDIKTDSKVLKRRKITKEDLMILNEVLKRGKVTTRTLSSLGRRSRWRLDKLREEGLIGKYYMLGLPHGSDLMVIEAPGSLKEYTRLTEVLASVSTVAAHYLEGPNFEGTLALVLPDRRIRGDMVRYLKIFWGDSLQVAEDILEVPPCWGIPVELWDEEKRFFRWREPLDLLEERLRF